MLSQEQNSRFEELENSYLGDFCERIGMRYFFHSDFLWQSMGLRLFVPTPNCFPAPLSEDDLELMWQNGALLVQHIVTENQQGFPSYAFVIDDKGYDLDSIKSSDRRHNIRRAFKNCSVAQVSLKSLLPEIPKLISDTYARQDRNCAESVLNGWRDYIVAAESNPLFSSWATFVKKELAAVKIEFRYKGGIHPEALFSRSDLLKYYTMNALLFVSTKQTIRRDDVQYISHGMRPVTGEKESLVNFKESMGFKKMLVNERLEVNPKIKLLFNGLFANISSLIPQKLCQNSEYMRLIQGILATLNRQSKYI
ncbi:MAG: hypothetical protein AB7V04_07080 [Desulfomonilaceae bacterium]